VEIELRQVASPRGHRLLLEYLVRVQAELPHPIGLVLQARNPIDDFTAEALLALVHVRAVVGTKTVFILFQLELGLRHRSTPLLFRDKHPILASLPESPGRQPRRTRQAELYLLRYV